MPCGVVGGELQAATAVQVPRLLRNASRIFDPGPPSVDPAQLGFQQSADQSVLQSRSKCASVDDGKARPFWVVVDVRL